MTRKHFAFCAKSYMRITQEKLDSKNFYAFNPSFDNGKSVIQPRN